MGRRLHACSHLLHQRCRRGRRRVLLLAEVAPCRPPFLPGTSAWSRRPVHPIPRDPNWRPQGHLGSGLGGGRAVHTCGTAERNFKQLSALPLSRCSCSVRDNWIRSVHSLVACRQVPQRPSLWAAKEGDVCFWHGQLVHGSSPNLRQPRLALFGKGRCVLARKSMSCPVLTWCERTTRQVGGLTSRCGSTANGSNSEKVRERQNYRALFLQGTGTDSSAAGRKLDTLAGRSKPQK